MVSFLRYNGGMNVDPLYPNHAAPCHWTVPNWCSRHPKKVPVPPTPPMPMPPMVPARIVRGVEPECPPVATIPIIEVITKDSIKDLANCYVHVDENNTTYYIDHQHRILQIYAGPVEVDDYNYEENSLGLRSQEVWDFKNKRVIKYSKTGSYMIQEAA